MDKYRYLENADIHSIVPGTVRSPKMCATLVLPPGVQTSQQTGSVHWSVKQQLKVHKNDYGLCERPERESGGLVEKSFHLS